MKNEDDPFMKDTHEALQTAMAEASNTAGINVRGGKEYLEVKKRIEIFRKNFGTALGIETEILVADNTTVRVKAIVRDKAAMIVGSGIAEELRGSTNVNKTSAVENAETSAIGRALASIGLHGSEYASANEMDAVVRKEKAISTTAPAPASNEMTVEDAEHLLSMEQRSIESMTSLSQIKSYPHDNSTKLRRLRETNSEVADRLVKFWINKRKELENG